MAAKNLKQQKEDEGRRVDANNRKLQWKEGKSVKKRVYG